MPGANDRTGAVEEASEGRLCVRVRYLVQCLPRTDGQTRHAGRSGMVKITNLRVLRVRSPPAHGRADYPRSGGALIPRSAWRHPPGSEGRKARST
eukprot:1036709-Prymnesium_polylepis.1